MDVTTAMLADAARVEAGKLFIHGGGWDLIQVPGLPFMQPCMALALIFRVPYDEALTDIPILIELVDEDENSMGPRIEGVINSGHPPRTRRGTPTFQPLAMSFNLLPFEHEGGYRFKVMTGDQELASIPFRVRTAA
jgi:hypothetical protein